MGGFRRVLCATDLSDAADWAIRSADREARLYGADLVLLHVVPMDPGAPMSPALMEETMLQQEELNSDLMEALLERVERLTGRDAGTVSLIIEEGVPDEVIADQADQVGADLIVVGHVGKSGRQSRLFGGTAERVVREAHVSVLVVRPGLETGRIVLATDFASTSEPAIALAAEEAVRRCSSVLAVHSVELVGPEMALSDPPMLIPIAAYPLPEMREVATRRLGEVLARAGIPGDVAVTEGPPAQAIVQVAAQQRADLVVIGTSGSSGIDRFLLGSVARQVVRDAPCSVLVARPAPPARHTAVAIETAAHI
jgi:nucleotide-binding universal stress UspA family protein